MPYMVRKMSQLAGETSITSPSAREDASVAQAAKVRMCPTFAIHLPAIYVPAMKPR